MSNLYNIVTPFVARWEGYVGSPYFCPTGHLTIGYGTLVKRGKFYGGISGGQIIHVAKQIKFEHRGRIRSVHNKFLENYYGNLMPKNEAMAYLERSLRSFWRQIAPFLPQGLTDNQCAAVLSLAYNIGVSAFKSSTALKRMHSGNMQGAANALTWWNKGRINGVMQVISGLNRRRIAEKALFLRK